MYLQNPGGITIHVGAETCSGMSFKYDNVDIPRECRMLFIDGPDGEWIKGLEIFQIFTEREDRIDMYRQRASESFEALDNSALSRSLLASFPQTEQRD